MLCGRVRPKRGPILRERALRLGVGRMTNDAAYYGRRAQQEREAALKSADERARNVHLAIAEAYEAKISHIAATERRSGVHLVQAG